MADHLCWGTQKCRGLDNDRRHGERCRSTSRILPGYLRRPKVAEVLLARHLLGLSTRDPRPALGEGAVGLSATNIGRLTAVCVEEEQHSQAQPGWLRVSLRVGEGVFFNVRLGIDQTKLEREQRGLVWRFSWVA